MGDAGHDFESYYKRATSPLVVLSLLRERVMYGYEISQAMKKRSCGRFTSTVLYPIVNRLEEQGYVRVERTEVVQNRARSYYAITPKGKKYLDQCIKVYYEMHRAFIRLIEGGCEDDTGV